MTETLLMDLNEGSGFIVSSAEDPRRMQAFRIIGGDMIAPIEVEITTKDSDGAGDYITFANTEGKVHQVKLDRGLSVINISFSPALAKTPSQIGLQPLSSSQVEHILKNALTNK